MPCSTWTVSRWCSALTLILVSILLVSPASAYILNDRWNATATDGPGLVNGDATTITWSIVPDNTPSDAEGPSDLISFLDTIIGAGPGGNDLTQRPWFTYFDQSFNRWSELSGMTSIYEPNDDGALHSTLANPGVLGVRGDVRIAGSLIDGNSNVLAFNFFPQNGDMTLDTGDVNIYGNPANNYLRLRNIIMHEHGHGLGLSHVESNNANFLMEPFLATSFDGPQLDDIRGLHRGYGDRYEKTNNGAGNDIIGNAFHLGTATTGVPIVIGTSGSSTAVAPTDVDFVSIDQNTDTDFFSFSVDSPGLLDIELRPQGTTYSQGPQGGSQSSFSSLTTSDLELAFFDVNQSLLATIDNTANGSIESLLGQSISTPGDYFVRVRGDANNIQFYQLTIDFESMSNFVDADFDDNGLIECLDVDALVAAIAGGGTALEFDLTGDGTVDEDDLGRWLVDAGAANLSSGGALLAGDADLDGAVDLSDFNIWNMNKFSASVGWCSGDFTADGVINVADFEVWNSHKFQVSGSDFSAVPEPNLWGSLFGLAGFAMLVTHRTRK